MAEPERNEEESPSLALAYEYVRPSYELAFRRLDSIESRLHAVTVLIASFTFAIPALAKAINAELSFRSPVFYAALAMAVLITGTAAALRLVGGLVVVDPDDFQEDEWRRLSPELFQRWMIYWAGIHFEKNRALIEMKARFAI